MNLLYLTMPDRSTLVITEDLVGCVLRQYRFVEKMNELDWLLSPVVDLSMREALVRYQRFMQLFQNHEGLPLVPTLDIDLIWHTHQLCFKYYLKESLVIKGMLIDHCDKMDETILHKAYEKTARAYKSRFKLDYTVCLCWYCMAVKDKSKSLFRKDFRSKTDSKYDLVYYGSTGASHISVHNAILSPTPQNRRRLKNMQKKYKSDDLSRKFPWKDVQSRTAFYVVPPFAPVGVVDAVYYRRGIVAKLTGFVCSDEDA